MDFFRKAADAVGGLILDSDSDSEGERGESAARRAERRTAAEKNHKTRLDDHWTDGGMDLGADARASGSDDGAPPEGADGSFETSDDEGDEKLIPDAVWGALAAARGKISEVASTVRADVGRDALQGHDGHGSRLLSDAGLLRVDDIHDDATLEHLHTPGHHASKDENSRTSENSRPEHHLAPHPAPCPNPSHSSPTRRKHVPAPSPA